MYQRYPNLLSPLKVGNALFRNRIFSAPMTLHSLQGGEPHPTDAVIAHFANKARGGAASVTCAGVNITPARSDGSHACWDVYTKHSLHYLAQLADSIHFYGAKAAMEIGGMGRSSKYAVSRGIVMLNGAISEEMPEEEMDYIADSYAYAANAVKLTGFDMVMIHFGHGNDIAQFLSPLTNKRNDKYGGTLENRARFPIIIIDRIREKVGEDFLIKLRISGSELEPGGIVVEESIEFVKMIQDRIDLIQVSAGMHNPRWMAHTHPSSFLPPMPNVYLAEAVKRSGVKIPVIAIGGIQDLDGAERIIADGRADAVSMARGMIADPDLAAKASAGRGEDVVPCIKCLRCHDSSVYGYRYVCSVNPAVGREHKLADLVRPPEGKRKVVVVGGGPAGMEAALVAAQRGHDVTLFEQSEDLGGQIRIADYVSFKYDLRRFKNYLIRQVSKLNIKVCLSTRATPALVGKENADVVIVAIGAEPVVPVIPGIDGGNVMVAPAVYGKEDQVGWRVAVIGGGQVGCETGLHLAQMGKDVTIMEMRDKMAADASVTHRGALMIELAAAKNINCLTEARCIEIAEQGIKYADNGGIERWIEVDAVVIAAGMTAKQAEAEAFRGSAGRYVSVGDCVRPANVEKAMYAAFDAASRF